MYIFSYLDFALFLWVNLSFAVYIFIDLHENCKSV